LVYDDLPDGTIMMDERDLSESGRARIYVRDEDVGPRITGYTFELKEAFRIPLLARIETYSTTIAFRDEEGYGPVPATSRNSFAVKALGQSQEGEVEVTYSDYQCPAV
jgi:hypothetical protein